MGIAKRRGTFEQRKEQAIERNTQNKFLDKMFQETPVIRPSTHVEALALTASIMLSAPKQNKES